MAWWLAQPLAEEISRRRGSQEGQWGPIGLKGRPLDGGYGHYCRTLSQRTAAGRVEVKPEESKACSDQADKYETIHSASFSDTSRVLRDGPVTL